MAEDTRILGTLRAAGGKGIVRMEDRVDADIDEVWAAFTEPDRLAGWLGEFEGDLRPGGAFRARFTASGWEGTGRIEAWEPPHLLRWQTSQLDRAEEQELEVTLAADGNGTIVVWEERGLPIDLLKFYGAGIQVHVEDLAAYLAGRGRVDAQTRFDELVPAYEALA